MSDITSNIHIFSLLQQLACKQYLYIKCICKVTRSFGRRT